MSYNAQKEQTHTLAKEIAARLDVDWVYIPSKNKDRDGEIWWHAHITRTSDQAEIGFHHSKERWQITAQVPHDWRKDSYIDGNAPKITCDAAKTFDRIVKDIKSRLLPNLDEWHTTQRERWQQAHAFEKNKKATIERLQQAIGVEPPSHAPDHIYAPSGDFRVNSGESIDVKLSCTLEQALFIAGVLQTWKEGETKCLS